MQRLYAQFKDQAGVLAELGKTQMDAARRRVMLTLVERIGVARLGD